MPKPQWGWFMVGVAATITCIFALNAGLGMSTADGGSGQRLLLMGIAVVAMFSFGRAFFSFRKR